MKRPGHCGLLILFIWSAGFTAAGQVWLEDFTAEGNGATSGTASGTIGGTWNITAPGGGSFFRFDAGAPYGPIFLIDNTVTEGVWRSNSINISALGDVAIEATIGGLNASGADYVRAYYKVDGGPEILFAQVTGAAGLVSFTAASAIVNGNTLQIVIRGKDTAGGAMGFDNVSVTDISVLYSIASAAWNNGNTWSTVGFAGAACSCTPDADSRVVIGNGRTVTFTADGTTAGVEIQNTGRLQWTATSLDLAMARGGVLDVQSGGVLTRNGQTSSSISFGNYTYSINIAGTADIGLLTFGSSSNSSIANSGTVTLSSATGLTMASGVGYSITNTGTFNLTGMDLNNADLTINNSGTINQSGNFSNIDNGSSFNNLATGTWNWSLTPNIAFDGTVTSILDCTAPGNIFNYNGAGAQRIIPISYHHLTLSASGAKDANNASFSVAGDWIVSGTASFTEGTGTVTLDGNSAQTITNPAGETFNNLIINNSSATSPQITLNNPLTISTVLTMSDGNVDLNGKTVTLSSSAAGSLVHNLSAAAGWMYGGSLTRAFTTTNITVGTVAGFFPLGDASDFRPFFIGKNNPAGSNGTMTITYTPATTATDITFTDNTIPVSAGTVTIQRRHDSFWTIAKTGMTAGTYNLRAGGTGFTIGAAGDLRLTRASDATGIGTAAASSIATGDVRVNRTGLTAAQLVNSYYVASLNKTNSPLPVTLLYFDARVEGDEVVTAWKTAQEKDNDFFTLQKTTDFETFYDVGSVRGQGTTREEHVYSFTDISPFAGKSYYRLRQTDFDGAFTYSKPVFINYEGLTSPMLKVYPNPFNGEQLTVEIKGLKDIGAVPVQIFDAQGHKVMDLVVEDNGPGIFKEEITFPSVLSPGLYIIRAGKTMQMIRKIFVTK